jgi:cell wall-associated NlpC family hydrolase
MKFLPAVASALAVSAAAAVVVGGVLISGTAASASTAKPAPVNHNPVGRVEAVYRSPKMFEIVGWASDPDVRLTPIVIQLTIDGHVATQLLTSVARPDIARTHYVGPNTGFIKKIPVTTSVHTICALAGNRAAGKSTSFGCFTMNAAGKFVAPPKPAVNRNVAIASLASKYVGHPYVEGAAGPTAFDCSGLVQYVYRNAAHISLPHNAQAQYNGARQIPAAQARAGDLVFFHSGGGVFHVGIYAGPNRLWAAATPHDGVRYQSIWSSAVSYGTVTH